MVLLLINWILCEGSIGKCTKKVKAPDRWGVLIVYFLCSLFFRRDLRKTYMCFCGNIVEIVKANVNL